MTCIETTLYQNDRLPLWHNIQITEKLFLGGVYMTPGDFHSGTKSRNSIM